MRYPTEQDLAAGQVRHDYTRDELRAIYQLPLPRLLRIAQTVHAQHWPDDEVQLCTLLSVKTGGCSENCGYCSQSAHHQASVKAHALLDVDSIVTAARAAKANGATRFCMGAAWRSPPKRGNQFDQVLAAVRAVRDEGLEVCTTLGMLTLEEAQALHAAGVYAYNHNLDTSPEYYGKVVTTRTYDDRLQTLQNVRTAGMTVCCGGIIGMGEGEEDRLGLIEQLTRLDPHPESVPVNLLVRVAGTPLGDSADLDVFALVRTVATCRITLPKSRVRLSAGRTEMRPEAQALCFTAGANSIFLGDKLLTTPNPLVADDHEMLAALGLRGVGSGAAVDSPGGRESLI